MWSSAPAAMCRFACSDEPTLPSVRSASISLFTASRISRMRAHFASSAASGVPNFQYIWVKIDADLPGAKTCHASSAVKLRNGAIQRSIACAICHSAVCAERRASDFGAVV